MNQHLPPESVKELGTIPAGTIGFRPTEQFVVIRGTRRSREPYLEDALMSRFEVVAHISEDVEHLRQIAAFDLTAGTSRDATDEITSIVIERWAQDGKTLTPPQKEFVAMCKGEEFANSFQVEE